MEKLGFGMVVRSGGIFLPLVKRYFDAYVDDTCMIYSMWSGYKDFSAVKEMLDCCKTVKDVHVSGHITKEDLERVIKVVASDKLIVHHTDVCVKIESNISVPIGTELVSQKDGHVLTV